ncbi:50S ribosomal protein 5 [Arabidopsis thaliana]|uniref:50S ribosomal protein 5, chloroplastic n=3 Tax=Arabidopsis TaxID=3701 RepID=A0A8T2FIF2_ARASU|nr:hypothetical protein ISN45_At03g049890 [Arabidopsis thaliana x Arabidopsis arenosa]KAG7634704.1 hypothetical protein ISN44_As03g048720 [Arabidopsis suecica]OAP04202.1 PSRP5 [Arabidopsis thaliana]CAA0386890.1 unnamed protein product [Arabidopsis thaliana]CAD5326034.1 unnamed protein product [Arabidopsis thaliana]
MALLCFNSLPSLSSLSSSSSSRLLQSPSFASPVLSLKPNAVESKNRVSLSAYSLNSSHGRIVVKAAASGVDGAEPESNEEPKTVVAAVPVDKLPLESKEAKEKLLLELRLKMKLAKKIRLRRKRLVRKRKMRKKGRWPPSKMKKNKNV